MSASFKPGIITGLIGPSGCGKTTLLRHIAGFYEPDHGKIFFDEEDVTRVPAHLRETGMMFQSYALWPHLNVAQNVAFLLSPAAAGITGAAVMLDFGLTAGY